MFREMRRADRKLSEEEAWEVIAGGKTGVLSVLGVNGYPYGVPLHYVFIDGTICFHGAAEGGHKDESMMKSGKVCFTVVEPLKGARAQSAIVFGTASPAPDLRERILEKIVEKNVPAPAWEQAKSGIPLAREQIRAWQVRADHISGKWVDKPERQ